MLAVSSAPIAPENCSDGIETQTTQAMRNVLTVLAAAGTGPEHVVKLNIYLVNGVDAQWDMRRRDQCGAITARPSRSFPPQDTLARARWWRSTQ